MRMPWEITREMFLSLDEVERLLRHVRSAERAADGRAATMAALDRVIVESLLFSGLRSSEFCALMLGDARLDAAQPHFFVRAPRKGDREVFLPTPLVDLLVHFIAHVRPLLLPDGVRPRDADKALLFNEHRQPYERTGLYRRVVRVLTDAGLGDRASVQLLRHTYGYLAYARTGGNLLFVQRQLGHAHPMVTSIYAQFVDESYADLAEMTADAARPQGYCAPPSRPVRQTLGVSEWKRMRASRKSSSRKSSKSSAPIRRQ